MIYTNSKGIQIDTSTMPAKYLASALAKAKDLCKQENIDALEQEIALRQDNNTTL